MSTDLISLWGAIQRGDTHAIASHIFPPSADTANKSLSHGQKDVPHAGLRSVEAGTPIVRYWTVKFERGGRTYYDHVEACDAWKASLVVFKRKQGATSTQVVREIDRDEFEHLTRASP
jgi:hypothetical protein